MRARLSPLTRPLRARVFYPFSRLAYGMYLNHFWFAHWSTAWTIAHLSGILRSPVLVFIAGCGEPMQFENAGSKHALAEDQRACDLELQSPTGVQYVEEAKGLVDPWQVCIERKGWTRAYRPVSPSSGAKL